MNYIIETVNNLEKFKDDLIILNGIYDEVFQPWINSVDINSTDDEPMRYNAEINQSKAELHLLYELENVLIKASNCTENNTKTKYPHRINANVMDKRIESIINNKSSVKTANLLPNREKKEKIAEKINKNSCENSKSKPKSKQFLAAHKTAPFKTDPNLHQNKPKIDPNKRRSISANRPIKQLQHQSIIEISPIINQDINTKPETVPDVQLNEEQNNKHVEQILSQLRVDIKRIKEIPQKEETIKAPINEKKTIFETKDGLVVPVELRRELRTYSKLTSKLASIYLHRIRPESANSTNRVTKMILGQRKNIMQDLTWQIHRISSTGNVLDHVVDMVKLLDLTSINISQVGFLQGCLSWVLTAYLDAKSNCSEIEIPKQEFPKLSQSTEIRQWLDSKLKSKKSTKEMFSFSIQTASLLSSPFVKSLETKKNNPISLTVPFSSAPQAKFTLDGKPVLGRNPYLETSTLALITQQTFQLSLTILMAKWIREFKEKNNSGINLSSSFRQIFGLFLSKYPVILKENL